MKTDKSTIILILIFLAGLSLLLYPSVSNYWNSFHQSQAISRYTQEVVELDNELYDQMLQEAREYNAGLVHRETRFLMTPEERAVYDTLLDPAGTGIMGYVDVPAINSSLPIYHSTDEAVLQVAIGHIEGSSLPVGGESSHSVISGHRGLPSAQLFSKLDKLTLGDTFTLKVLDELLSYEVDQILIVEPHEMDALAIEEGKDLCTLVTCTPYGVNTHRLLVRGHRIDTVQTFSVRVTADAIQLEPILVAPIVAAPMLFILLVWLLVSTRKRR